MWKKSSLPTAGVGNSKKLHGLSLKDILDRANLPWRKLAIEIEGGVVLDYQYPLTPKFFLNSAKDDLKDGTPRGLVNALSNAKRAIDCQTDSFLCAIGYSPKALDKQLGKPAIESLRHFTSDLQQPLKFRVLESLGIVTPAIVNRVRHIRNLLEHEYKKPTRKAVTDAIEIAALYVGACQGAMNAFLTNVHMGYGEVHHPLLGERVFARVIEIELETLYQVYIHLFYRDRAKAEQAEIKLFPTDPCYLALLRVLFAVRAEENIEQAITVAATTAGVVLDGIKVKVQSIGWA